MSDTPAKSFGNGLAEQLPEAELATLSDDQLESVAGGIEQYQIKIVETDVKLCKHVGISPMQAWHSKKAAIEEGKCHWTMEMLEYMLDHWSEIK